MLHLIIVVLVVATSLGAQSPAERLPMNQVQVLGSHNSYKLPIDPALLQILRKDKRHDYSSLEYSHASLTEQMELGLRNLEIDVVYDPQGGLYADPLGLRMVKQAGVSVPGYDPEGMMKKPGFKVLHVPDLDFRTHAYTLQQALQQLKSWSDAHPRHLPIVITMNAKDGGLDIEGAVKPLQFDAAAFDAWDAEIRAVMPPAKLLTPDDVRGKFPTLEAAVKAHAWPAVGKARGRFLFVLDENGPKLEIYAAGHPSLKGRVMFTNAIEGRPEAAFRIVNDPVASFHYIRSLVRSGYLVRTRADAETLEARKGDYSRMQAAFDSGAHFVTTDYYRPDPALGTGYAAKLPGGSPGRWNPILPPPLQNLSTPE